MTLSREHFEELTKRSPDIIVGTDRKGRVVYYNDGAHDSLGYESDEVLGQFVGLFYPSVEEAKRVAEAMRGPEQGGVGVCNTLETTFVARNGDLIPVAISGTILYDEKGEEDGTIGFAKDLRDILHKDQLATLGEVAIGLSHEINNPLSVIVNQATLLENDIARLAEMVKSESYETTNYVGPARMVDLRDEHRKRHEPDARLAGLRILVADDDAGISRTLKDLLEVDGCLVQIADNGAEALEALQRESFDLLLSDVVMPQMDGHELYLRVREAYPDMPVLMMTAFHYDKDHIIKRSRMEGLEGVIFKKPVDPERLRQVIAESVGRS